MSAELESPTIPANCPPQLRQYQITSANAQALARKSHESKRLRLAQEAESKAKLEAEAELARKLILANALANPAPVALEPDDHYRLKSLARTRELIEMLETKLVECEEMRDYKAIADSIARLRDVEQTLAKRPKPAAYRTAPEKPTKRSGVVEPED